MNGDQNPTITIQAKGSALAFLHSTAGFLAENLVKPHETEAAAELMSLRRTIESALRSHGWRPGADGRWVRLTASRR